MDNMELQEAKKQLRNRMRFIRDNMSQDDRASQNEAITRMILGTELYENAKFILSYVSFGAEVDTKELLRQAIKDAKMVYVPKILSNGTMDFFRCENLADLQMNSMGIMEPEANPSKLFPYTSHISLNAAPDCVLFVPGLAFDSKLNRIGYGKGYYDAYLKRFQKKMAIGLAFNDQIVDQVPVGENDAQLDLVVTPGQAFF